MTEIKRELLVDGIDTKNVVAGSFISCPKKVQDYICKKEKIGNYIPVDPK